MLMIRRHCSRHEFAFFCVKTFLIGLGCGLLFVGGEIKKIKRFSCTASVITEEQANVFFFFYFCITALVEQWRL
jgi:hypothetical protein